MFNFRRKHQRHCHRGNCPNADSTHSKDSIPITKAPEKQKFIVIANSDIKTMEMGLYPGSVVSLIHNEIRGRNIIVKIHDQRYVIPCDIAEQILVRRKPDK